MLFDSKINENRKIEENKKLFHVFKQEEDNYKPVKIGNAFSSN